MLSSGYAETRVSGNEFNTKLSADVCVDAFERSPFKVQQKASRIVCSMNFVRLIIINYNCSAQYLM